MSERVFKQRVAALIYVVRAPKALAATETEWEAGPLPIVVPGQGSDTIEVADAAWRMQQTAGRVHGLLYGSGRQHRSVDAALGFDGLVLTGLEFLAISESRVGSVTGLLAAHLDCGGVDGSTLITALGRLARHLDKTDADAVVGALESWLPNGVSIDRAHRAATSLVFVTAWPGSQVVAGPDGAMRTGWRPEEPETWSRVDQWRWSLAMLTPPGHAETPHVPDDQGTLIAMPGREGQVVPRGVSILGIRADSNRSKDPQAFQYLRDAARVRTIYLDALMLGVAQRLMIDVMSDRAADLVDPANRPYELRDLQRELRLFRNRVWWTSFATAWAGHPDKLLQAFHSETGAASDLDALIGEIKDHAAEVEVANARRTNMLITCLTLVGVIGVAASTVAALRFSTAGAAVTLGAVATAVLGVGFGLARTWGWFLPRS